MVDDGGDPARLTSLVLRTATADDLDALLPLIHEFEQHDGYRRDDDHVRGALVPLLRNPDLGWVAVAELAGSIVGYAVLTWGWGLESGGRESLLDEIYAARRGRGIGTELFAYCLRLARDAGARTLFLETERVNDRARSFYLRQGMQAQDSIWLSTRL